MLKKLIFFEEKIDKFYFDLDYFSDKETLFLAGSMYLFLKITSIIISKLGQEHIVNEPIHVLLNNTMQDSFIYFQYLKDHLIIH